MKDLFKGRRGILVGVLLLAGLVRLLTLGAYPLFDNTEARYAEIARKMAETGNWIMPQYDYGVPFWGKPPLSIWASALSFKILGVNEFAARLPSFLFSAGVVLLAFVMAARWKGRDHALAAAAVLSTTVLFFVGGASVMTDPSMVFGTTLSMAAFWFAMEDGPRRRLWGYLFFVGLAVGLLAKGPVAVVLTFIPIGVWTLWKRRSAEVWRRLPWVTGSALTLLLAVPWYLAAEKASPGFLNYFIVGEHIDRFTKSGWRGDLYGSAHSRMRGAIWLYFLGATFPWCLAPLARLLKRQVKFGEMVRDDRLLYLLLWAVTPMAFFTLSGNILWTYVMPGLPAFALLTAGLLTSAHEKGERRGLAFASAGALAPAALLAFVLFFGAGRMMSTQKGVIEGYLKARPGPASRLVYLFKRPYSAEFYSGGKAAQANFKTVDEILDEGGSSPSFFVVEKGGAARLPVDAKARLFTVKDYGKYLLMEERGNTASAEKARAYPVPRI